MTHSKYEALKAKLDMLDDIYDDLPDGAYFAILEENGIAIDDLADMAGYEMEHNLTDRRFGQ